MSNAHEEPDQDQAGGTEGDETESASAQPGEGGPLGPGEADLEQLDEDDAGRQMGPGLAGTVALDPDDVKGALEALILVSDKPVPAMRLARLTRQDLGLVRRVLGELSQEYAERGIALDEVAGGYQFRTAPRYAPFVRNLTQQKPTKLTRAQLEVLAIIAYRQPVTRPEIDDVRGVDSGSAIKVLLERDVIKIIGKRDDAGRPMLYATTNGFLELFGLKNLRDLPTLKEFAELSPESRDIYERRIGEPLPGQGQGMDLETHYEAQPHDESDEREELDGEASAEHEAPAEHEQDASEPNSEAEASDDAHASDATLPDEP